ncbi:hypothetical protein RAH32_01900 [Paracoccus sp. WLY502]|nr:hypothetical protein [Paracoccus sp. WLY502]
MALAPVADFDSSTGKGALGFVEGRRIALGNAKFFLAEQGVDVTPLAEQANRLRQNGATSIFTGVDGQVAAIFAIADPVEAWTPKALAALKARAIPAYRQRPISGCEGPDFEFSQCHLLAGLRSAVGK